MILIVLICLLYYVVIKQKLLFFKWICCNTAYLLHFLIFRVFIIISFLFMTYIPSIFKPFSNTYQIQIIFKGYQVIFKYLKSIHRILKLISIRKSQFQIQIQIPIQTSENVKLRLNFWLPIQSD